jgi:hypothetical protein
MDRFPVKDLLIFLDSGFDVKTLALKTIISYSHAEKEFVSELREMFVQVGEPPWLDWTHVGDANNWLSAVYAAIENCANFIFVITPESLRSGHCLSELHHAVNQEKNLVSLLRREHDGLPLPASLRRQPQIDFRKHCNSQESFGRLMRSLIIETTTHSTF